MGRFRELIEAIREQRELRRMFARSKQFRERELPRLQAQTAVIREGIEFYSLTSQAMLKGPMELNGEFFRLCLRDWIGTVAREKAVLLNRACPNEALAQSCDVIDTTLRMALGLSESHAKPLIEKLANDLAATASILEQELQRTSLRAA